jgi:hypothetical protein
MKSSDLNAKRFGWGLTGVFWPWEWLCARSEIKSKSFELDGKNNTITTPRIRKYKMRYEQVMDDVLNAYLAPARGAVEREIAVLFIKEEQTKAMFMRQLELADGEPPLRNSMNTLMDCQGAIVKHLSALQQHILSLQTFFALCFKNYDLRIGKYLEALSRRMKRSLHQPYRETEFVRIAQMREEAEEIADRIAQYRAMIDDEQRRFQIRIREMNRTN